MMNDPRHLLTGDEHQRFGLALFFIIDADVRRFYHSFSDYAMSLLPTVRLEQCVEKLGAAVFAHRLLEATLNIYHDAPEWMGVCYGVALELDECRDVIIDYLITGPADHRAFIARVLNQIEEEMTTQIASQYMHTPFSLSDRHSTHAFFDVFYPQTLRHIASIKDAVARRRLLL